MTAYIVAKRFGVDTSEHKLNMYQIGQNQCQN